MSSVVLQVYDLSQGMARMMSRAVIGRQIDGIWHTSVVVFGLEYFYGGGIAWMQPKTTPYGHPVREEAMGQTTKTKTEFEAFLRKLNPRYSMEGYHILYHNCNNFTNDCLAFLLGKSLPADIKDLPAEFLSTSLGKTFEPMINRMMQMTSSFGPGQTQSHDDLISHEMIFTEGMLADVTSHDQLHTLMKREKCVLLFWEAERVLEISEAFNLFPSEFPAVAFGCVDSVRYPYLSPVEVPQIHVYENNNLTLRLTDYNLNALRKALGGRVRPNFQFKVLSLDKSPSLPVDWKAARSQFLAMLKVGKLDAIDPQHMEVVAMWAKRNVVLNIPEFISALIEVVRKVADCDPAIKLLAVLARENTSNEEISKIVGSSLPSLVGKSPITVSQIALLVNLATRPKGEALLKSQVSSLLPVLLSALLSDSEEVTVASCAGVLALQKVQLLSLEDSQEITIALFDRLNAMKAPETIESVACALGVLMASREEVADLIRELGPEAAEEKLLGSEDQRLKDVGEDLKKLWGPRSD